MSTETTTTETDREARLRERAEHAEAELMKYARQAEMLRVNRDQLKDKLKEAESVIKDFSDAEVADRKRMHEAEAALMRVRRLCDDMEAHCGGERVNTPSWVGTVRKALKGDA